MPVPSGGMLMIRGHEADWMIATVGELGEAANFLKKLRRSAGKISRNTESILELEDRTGRGVGRHPHLLVHCSRTSAAWT